MPERKLSELNFLRIRTDTEEDAIYALGALQAVRIDSVIGEVYRTGHITERPSSGYIESVITLNKEYVDEAIDILRHLSIVNRLWIQEVSYETLTELETEYTRSLGEDFLPEHKIP